MPRAIEVFSGCGGLSCGLEAAGFEVLSAVEIDKTAADTYKTNHPNVDVVVNDVRKVKTSYFLQKHNLRRGELELLAGCSPCQGFSRLRKDADGDSDPRNQLVHEYVRLVRGLMPKTIFMENVPGLINTDRGLEVFHPVRDQLKRLGYHVDYKVIDAVGYGVPQFRKRFVLLGSRYKHHQIQIPDRTHVTPQEILAGENKLPWNTVRDTIYNVPPLENGEVSDRIPLHKCTHNGELNLRRIQSVPHDGGSRVAFPDELVLECHRNYPDGFRDVYGRMSWDRPSPTLTGGCINITKGRFVHPDQDRGISLYEAAKLQSFPDNYLFTGNIGQIALQIGNAVPVRLAEAMGAQLLHCLETIEG